MAHKTLKQKQAADNRRRLEAETQLPGQITMSLPRNYSLSATGALQKDKVGRENEKNSDYAYVTSDLRRILVLTALAFCAQLVLWYLLGRR